MHIQKYSHISQNTWMNQNLHTQLDVDTNNTTYQLTVHMLTEEHFTWRHITRPCHRFNCWWHVYKRHLIRRNYNMRRCDEEYFVWPRTRRYRVREDARLREQVCRCLSVPKCQARGHIPSVCLSFCLHFVARICLSFCPLSTFRSACLSVFLSFCLHFVALVCLSLCMSVCLCACTCAFYLFDRFRPHSQAIKSTQVWRGIKVWSMPGTIGTQPCLVLLHFKARVRYPRWHDLTR